MSDKRPISAPGPITTLVRTQKQENDADLKRFGYAPGNYSGTCIHGPHLMENVDKRAVRCREHAIFLMHQQLLILEIDNAEKAKEIDGLKQRLDFRVKELLQAASREVIRRREINAHRMKLIGFVLKARDQFRFYERNHTLKAQKMGPLGRSTPERDAVLEKASVNDQFANEADEVVLWESPTGAMGTP